LKLLCAQFVQSLGGIPGGAQMQAGGDHQSIVGKEGVQVTSAVQDADDFHTLGRGTVENEVVLRH